MQNLLQTLRNISEILKKILGMLPPIKVNVVEPMEFTITNKPIMENKDKFYKIVIDALDTDVSPEDEVSDDVSCSQDLSTLIKKLFPDFPKIKSTKDLEFKLFMDKRFKRSDIVGKYKIIVSPAILNLDKTIKIYGHCGYFITDDRIASNTSFGPNKGKFMGNYTWNEWVNEFKGKRGLRIYIYDILG